MSRTIAALAVVAAGALLHAQVIDRIMAVVDNTLITQSDVMAAIRLGLVKVPSSGDPIAAVLDRLIDRRLTLTEVDRYAPPEPSAADVDRRLEQVRLSVPSMATFDGVLAQTGLDEAQLRGRLRDDLRIDAYLQQRFGSVVQPSDDQVVAYYRAHEDEFSRNGVVRPFPEVQDGARSALVAERRSALISDWVATLRRRANVSVLYAGR